MEGWCQGKRPETNVLKELFPYLEKQYAATGDRRQRTIMGFSMGAAGSIYWGAKYLDLFSTAVALDAGGGTSFTDPKARNYVPEYGRETEAIRKSLKIRLVQGALNTRNFRASLDTLKIPYDYVQLPRDISAYPAGSSCLNRKDPTKKFLHNPACMTEGKWGSRPGASSRRARIVKRSSSPLHTGPLGLNFPQWRSRFPWGIPPAHHDRKPRKQGGTSPVGIILISAFLPVASGAPEKNPPAVLSEVLLRADIDSGKKAVAQVQAVFGKYSIETPESFQGNHAGFEHLKIEADHQMGPCFTFYLHRDKDGDRDRVWPRGKERQRNEIKGYQGSPQTLKSSLGEITRYHWFLKIDESFAVTKNFCHFFQLKPVGGKHASDPVVTLSGAVYRGKPQLELRWWTENGPQRIRIADWGDCRGKWLECKCVLVAESNGRLRFSIRSQDQSIRFARDLPGFPAWRPGFDFIRPKWGIYRSLADKAEIPNEEDRVRMANLSIAKLASWPDQKSGAGQLLVNAGKPAARKNKESYGSAVPKPTLSEIRYGRHERNVS